MARMIVVSSEGLHSSLEPCTGHRDRMRQHQGGLGQPDCDAEDLRDISLALACDICASCVP
jgi:hypothetical protein